MRDMSDWSAMPGDWQKDALLDGMLEEDMDDPYP
jgi:hypothetical protein